MDTIPNVSSLAERKIKLLATCDLQREMITLEWQAIRFRCATLKGIGSVLPKIGMVAMPIMGFLAARRVKRQGAMLGKGWLLWSLARKGWKYWNSLKRS